MIKKLNKKIKKWVKNEIKNVNIYNSSSIHFDHLLELDSEINLFEDYFTAFKILIEELGNKLEEIAPVLVFSLGYIEKLENIEFNFMDKINKISSKNVSIYMINRDSFKLLDLREEYLYPINYEAKKEEKNIVGNFRAFRTKEDIEENETYYTEIFFEYYPEKYII